MGLPPFGSPPTLLATSSIAGKSRQFFYNVKDSGAKGDGSTDDTAALNGVLAAINTAGGGHAYLPAGTYVISAPLVIYSNTKLELDPAATVSLAASSLCNMLIDNSHYLSSLTVPSVMTNIEVCGGTWNRNNNNGTGLSLHTMILGGSSLYVHDLTFLSTGATAGKYALNIQNAINFKVQNVNGVSYHADLVHVSGPSQFGVIRNIYASANGDDVVAFTTNDVAAYQFGNEGDTTDMLLENVFASAQPVAQVVGIYSGQTTGATPLNTKRIKVKNVHGTMTSAANAAFYIGDFNNSVVGGGNMDDIVIDGVDVQWTTTAVAKPLININPNSPATSLGIGSIRISNVSINSDFSSIVQNFALVTSLMMSGVIGTTATTAFPSLGGFVYLSGSIAAITQLYCTNVDITMAGTVGGSLIKAITSGQSLSKVFISNVTLNNMFSIYDTAIGSSVSVSGIVLLSCTQLLNLRTGCSITIRGWSGMTSNTTGYGTPAGAISSKDNNFPFDVTNGTLSATKGDMAYNTASGATTGIGPVAYNGSSWQPMALTQGLYATSSPTFAKLNVTTGSNANAGTGTLVGGTVTISTTAVTASSLIFLTDTASSITNVGTLTVSSKSAGTSFTVTSTLALDTSTFNWLIIN